MSGLSYVKPENGGRVVLRRVSVTETAAHYVVQVLADGAPIEGTADVSLAAGDVQFQGLVSAPEWTLTLAKSLLRGAWRARNDSPWPRRLTRWREDPQT